MTQAEIVKICMDSATGAKRMIGIAGADSSPMASLCNGLVLSLERTAENVARMDPADAKATKEFTLSCIMRNLADLDLALAVLTHTRDLEARLREAEARPDGGLEARLRVLEAQLARRPAGPLAPRADLEKLRTVTGEVAKRVIEIAGADTSAIAQLCNTLASTLRDTLEDVAAEDATEAEAELVTNFVRQYQSDLHVATAALLETRAIEARLQVVEAQLSSQSHIDKLH